MTDVSFIIFQDDAESPIAHYDATPTGLGSPFINPLAAEFVRVKQIFSQFSFLFKNYSSNGIKTDLLQGFMRIL